MPLPSFAMSLAKSPQMTTGSDGDKQGSDPPVPFGTQSQRGQQENSCIPYQLWSSRGSSAEQAMGIESWDPPKDSDTRVTVTPHSSKDRMSVPKITTIQVRHGQLTNQETAQKRQKETQK